MEYLRNRNEINFINKQKKKEEEGEEKDKTKKLIQKSECGQYTLFAFITI